MKQKGYKNFITKKDITKNYNRKRKYKKFYNRKKTAPNLAIHRTKQKKNS